MTVFEGEMRRRIWALITQLDLLFSSSLGLPRLLDDRQADTVPPLNLLDEDLDPDMTEVPKPRPETEETWIGYMNFKSKPLGVLGKIVDRMNLVKEISYNEVLNLEQEIQAAVAAKPTWLKLPTNGQLANLPVSVITRLMSLDLITQRSRMILHPAMILCLDLNEVLLGKCEDVDVEEENKEREKRYKLLENSYKVWTDAMTHAPEARKAAAVLRVMLEKVEKRKMEKSATPNTEANFTSPIYKTSIGTASNASPMVEAEKVALPQPSQAVDLKPDPFLNYNGILSGEAESYLARGGYAYPNPVVFQNMLSSGGNFDWLEWDSQFPGQGLDLQP
ncbi:MAG: hypothetical protein LQ340_004512 [Diploschistes diacapsis]|nr:MAG: hypothetical protein LQ340_004512 [Diploschistes diacapsis]